MLALIPIGLLAVTIAMAMYVYAKMRKALNIPMYANLPGALAVFFAGNTLAGWLLYDHFSAHATLPLPPIEWYVWLGYTLFAVGWYGVFALVKMLVGRMAGESKP